MNEEKKSNNKDLVSAGFLFLLVISVWYFSWQYIDKSILSKEDGLSDIEARGLFGDKFGAINALFSALAFAGIIFTIFLQKRELKLQREEMKETRGEFIKQNETLIHQKFENTFFQLLKLLNTNIDSIDLRDKRSGIVKNTGRDCFKEIYKYWINSIKREINKEDNNDKKINNVSIDKALIVFSEIYDQFKSDLSHYFRTLYHIIKFIDQSGIDDKKQYISIMRAQLSSYEQTLLFYNCLHSNGSEKFKPLIEKYSLLKNIDKDLIINKNHLNEYHTDAYGRNTSVKAIYS
ncbi:hypothetical protein DMZ43_07205 [Meridianimaribacter sp. CL38]|uniref:putative phage abortive infection protein n=1 Tax=Meridianimaribacter sp. CL38 TaxID=2213021 RepID=UPI001039F61E|nr:putative phage abortive infection protein [Meridianimaribacter sp. CL38]TBV26846.1 hypothetical protein DMZ43_07205 [Meridianimaribacter sp. CL38]